MIETLATPAHIPQRLPEDQALNRLRTTAQTGASRAEMRQAAEEFEAMALNTFFASMFAGIETDGPFGGGQGEAMFRSLLHQEYAKSVVDRGGIGLADNVLAELQRLQEGS